MKVTIEVPDWMVRELEARTKKPLDAGLVKLALRAYYLETVAPALFPEMWSGQTKVAVFGDM